MEVREIAPLVPVTPVKQRKDGEKRPRTAPPPPDERPQGDAEAPAADPEHFDGFA